MKTEKPQSLFAAALIIGLILMGLGALGTCRFGSNPAQEKEQAAAPSPSLSPSPAQPSQTPEQAQAPTATPVATAPKPKTTPALITSESGSSAPLPSTTISEPETKWNLSDKQRKTIVGILGKHAGKTITISSVESDAQGFAFAGILKRAFEDAGWQVDGVKQVAYTKPPVGLNLASGSFPSPEALVAAWQAFSSAGIPVSQQLDSKLTGGQVELIVGARQ